MPRARSNGIEIEYERRGPADGPPVLLIMGIGQQLVGWPEALLDALTQTGLHLIRYDSRDTGLSTHIDSVKPPPVAEIFATFKQGNLPIAYTLDDLADDAAGLLDALELDAAHVVGVSMGGMVAQLVAARHPARVLSLTSIMSTTSEPGLPGPTPEALGALLNRPKGRDEDSVVAHGVNARQVLGSPGYPTADAFWAEQTRAAYRRDYSPSGFGRHLLAVLASGSRGEVLPTINTPALVLHGADDPLVPAACGERTAELLPNSRFEAIAGMGHDLAPTLAPVLATKIAEHVRAYSA